MLNPLLLKSKDQLINLKEVYDKESNATNKNAVWFKRKGSLGQLNDIKVK